MKTIYINQYSRTILDCHEVMPGVWRIARISTPPSYRRGGHASQLMISFLADIDEIDAEVVLEVMPSGTMNFDALLLWYQRLGFKQDLKMDHLPPHSLIQRMMPIEGLMRRPRKSDRP